MEIDKQDFGNDIPNHAQGESPPVFKQEDSGNDTPHGESPAVRGSPNICASEVDEETLKKLHGDRIGETAYRETFTLKTLLKFSNIEWNEEFEEDLCFLWDMSLENEVCEFLFKMKYPSIACSAIASCDENRFVEIAVGILANMFCADCQKMITEDEIRLILKVLYVDDAKILLQVMRFIHAVSVGYEYISFLSDEDLDRIAFILAQSADKELLNKALEAVTKITNDSKLDVAQVNGNLIKSYFTGYSTLYRDLKCKEQMTSFVQFMCNVCGYMTNSQESARVRTWINKHSYMFIDQITKIFNYHASRVHLFPVTPDFEFYAEAASYLLTLFSAGYKSNIFSSTLKIISLLLENDYHVSKSLLEIIAYSLSQGDLQDIKNDLKKVRRTHVAKVFAFISEEQFECEYPYREKFIILKDEFPCKSA